MLCQFLVLAGKRFWFNFGSKTYLLLRVQYSYGGALVFCLQWEIVFGVLHILSVQYSCALQPEKKDTVVCMAGARSLLRPEKKDTKVCLLGARFW